MSIIASVEPRSVKSHFCKKGRLTWNVEWRTLKIHLLESRLLESQKCLVDKEGSTLDETYIKHWKTLTSWWLIFPCKLNQVPQLDKARLNVYLLRGEFPCRSKSFLQRFWVWPFEGLFVFLFKLVVVTFRKICWTRWKMFCRWN